MKYTNEILKDKYVIVTKAMHGATKWRIFKLTAVGEETIVTNSGNVFGRDSDSNFEILSDVIEFSGMNIGEEATINRNTNSFKMGQKIIIKDFLNGDPDKILTDGVTPGGWIKSSDLIRRIDAKKYRLKTYLECCFDFGMDWWKSRLIDKYVFTKLGMNLAELEYKLTKEGSIYIRKDYFVPGIYFTYQDTPIRNLEVRVRTDKYEGNYKKDFIFIKGYHGKTWDSIRLHPNYDIGAATPDLFLKHLTESDIIKDIEGRHMDMHMFEVVEIS